MHFWVIFLHFWVIFLHFWGHSPEFLGSFSCIVLWVIFLHFLGRFPPSLLGRFPASFGVIFLHFLGSFSRIFLDHFPVPFGLFSCIFLGGFPHPQLELLLSPLLEGRRGAGTPRAGDGDQLLPPAIPGARNCYFYSEQQRAALPRRLTTRSV